MKYILCIWNKKKWHSYNGSLIPYHSLSNIFNGYAYNFWHQAESRPCQIIYYSNTTGMTYGKSMNSGVYRKLFYFKSMASPIKLGSGGWFHAYRRRCYSSHRWSGGLTTLGILRTQLSVSLESLGTIFSWCLRGLTGPWNEFPWCRKVVEHLIIVEFADGARPRHLKVLEHK